MGDRLSRLLSLGNVLYVLIGTALTYYVIVFLSLRHENEKERQEENDPYDKEKLKFLSAKFNAKIAVISFLIAAVLNPFFLGSGGSGGSGPDGPEKTDAPTFSPESSNLSSLLVGDIISFGAYAVDENSPKNNWPAIQWIVIETDGDTAQLLSKNGLRYMPYESESEQATIWLDSSIRKWLNEDFYETALGKAPFILLVDLYTDSPSFPKEKRKSTDYVYLLREEDVDKLLSPEDRVCVPTIDAISSFNGRELHMDGDAWYLREEGRTSYNFVATVDRDGTFTDGGSTNNGGGILIRPCITISIRGYLESRDTESTDSTAP